MMKSCSNKLSFENLFVEIGLENFEIFGFGYYFFESKFCQNAFENALHILFQCSKTFHMTYDTSLSDVAHDFDPGPDNNDNSVLKCSLRWFYHQQKWKSK